MGEWIQFVSGNSVYVDLDDMELLGSGSARNTYALSEELVIKHSKYDVGENRCEFVAYCRRLVRNLGLDGVAAVLGISVCGSYLLQERIQGSTLDDLDMSIDELILDDCSHDIHGANFMLESETDRIVCIDMGWESKGHYDSDDIEAMYNRVYLRNLDRVPAHVCSLALPTQEVA